VLFVAAGCNPPEKLDGEILDSRSFMKALRTSPYTCVEHRMLWKVQQRVAGISMQPEHDNEQVHVPQAPTSGCQQSRV